MAGQSAGVDHGVPDLAGIAGSSAERVPAGDDAGADARVPRQINCVVHASRRATHMLCADAKVGVVADHRRQAHRVRQRGADGGVLPAEVGCLPHLAVAAAHHAGHCHARADDDTAVDLGEQLGADLGDGRGHLALAPGATAVGAVAAGQDHSAQPDARHGQVRHADVDGEHLDAFGLRQHDVGRTPPAAGGAIVDPLRPARLLTHQPGGDELTGQVTDRAPVQTEYGGEAAARRRPVYVDVAQQRGEVPAPDVLGPRPSRTPGKDRHGACYTRPEAAARRRDSASTPAASSSTPPVTM